MYFTLISFHSGGAKTLRIIWRVSFWRNLESFAVHLLSCVRLLRPHGLQHARLPCACFTISGVCSNSCSLSWWCHQASLIVCCPLLLMPSVFPIIRVFPKSRLFVSDGQSIDASVSTSVLPMNILRWFPLGLSDLISLQSKGLSRVFSSTRIRKH